MRGRIRDIFADATLTPAQKFERVNALRGVGGTPKAPATAPIVVAPSTATKSSCPHYQRSCLLQCNVCEQMVLCRVCHDEMDRFKVAKLQCLGCNAVVAPAAECSNCHQRFATYVCTVCHTYDSTPGKDIFHCDDCGICRIGTRDTTHHCHKCDMCIVINSDEGKAHKCFANSFKQDCAACLSALFDSREPISMLKCGHAMHKTCFKTLLAADYRCPTCKKAVVDMGEQWAEFEDEMEESREQYAELTRQIPKGALVANLVRVARAISWSVVAEVLERVIRVLCNECEIKFDSQFSPFMMHKCPKCGGFNTNPIT